MVTAQTTATNQFVRIYNYGDEEFVGKYAGDVFVIPPGEERPVPWLAMRLWMGDPESHNNNPRYRHRVAEHKRLRCRYGAYEHNDLWEANKPKIKAYTWEGDPIITVLDDPDGEHVTPADVTLNENEMLKRRQKELEAELTALKRHILGPDGEPIEAQPSGPAPADTAPPGPPPLQHTPGTGGAAPGTPQTIPHPTTDGPPSAPTPGAIPQPQPSPETTAVQVAEDTPLQPPSTPDQPLKTVPTGPDGGPLLDADDQVVTAPESHEDEPQRPAVGERGQARRARRIKRDDE